GPDASPAGRWLSLAACNASKCSRAIWRPISRAMVSTTLSSRSDASASFPASCPSGGRLSFAGLRFPPSPSLSEVIEVELAARLPSGRIGDPAVNVGFMPSCAVDADPELGRERALGDLAVDGGPGQPGAGKNGLQTDDTVWLTHGCAASCWLF